MDNLNRAITVSEIESVIRNSLQTKAWDQMTSPGNFINIQKRIYTNSQTLPKD